MDQETKQQQKRSPLVIVLIIIIIVLIAAVAAVLVLNRSGGQEPAPVSSGEGTPKLGYQEGVIVLDEKDLPKSNSSSTPNKGVRVRYKKEAVSTDGETFSCLIANPDDSEYDIYIGIYGDEEFTDELYLSQLIPPGSALNEITISRKLEKGTHRVYLAYTQVEDDHATLHGQVFVAMDLIVQ